MIKTYLILPALLLFAMVYSCEAPEDEKLTNHSDELIRIDFLAVESTDQGDIASFLLVNDSTASVQYFAYDQTFPHYSTEVQNDTGWTYLFWNWCGTGADYWPLEPGAQVEFTTMLPQESCTWRVRLGVSDTELSTSYTLYSESIEYITP